MPYGAVRRRAVPYCAGLKEFKGIGSFTTDALRSAVTSLAVGVHAKCCVMPHRNVSRTIAHRRAASHSYDVTAMHRNATQRNAHPWTGAVLAFPFWEAMGAGVCEWVSVAGNILSVICTDMHFLT